MALHILSARGGDNPGKNTSRKLVGKVIVDRRMAIEKSIGGTSGIGLAAARRFVAHQEAVTIVGRDRSRLADALQKLGPTVRGEIADASDRTVMDALFGRIGPIDHLVLAASGGAGVGPFVGLEPEGLRRGFEAKFWVQWNAAQSALPHMAQGGSLTFITAASSRLANPGTSGLAAINGALERMTPTLARELAPLRAASNSRATGGLTASSCRLSCTWRTATCSTIVHVGRSVTRDCAGQ